MRLKAAPQWDFSKTRKRPAPLGAAGLFEYWPYFDSLVSASAALPATTQLADPATTASSSNQRSPKSSMQCAGLNRHEAGNERVLRERSSEPLGPEFCVAHREVLGEA